MKVFIDCGCLMLQKSLEMLNKRLNNTISAFEFQTYILDTWKYSFDSNINNSNSHIAIYERTPDDSVYCFAQLDLYNNRISNLEYENLNNMCDELRNKYQYPSVHSPDSQILTIQNTYNTSIDKLLNQILAIISRDLNSNVNN